MRNSRYPYCSYLSLIHIAASERKKTDNKGTTALKDWISVALPKGRLGEKAYDLFERIGFGCPAIREDNRKLIFENVEARVRYFWAKPSDCLLYTSRCVEETDLIPFVEYFVIPY